MAHCIKQPAGQQQEYCTGAALMGDGQTGCRQIYCRGVSCLEHPSVMPPPCVLPCLQVFTLQEALQSSRTIPIIRHTRSAICWAGFLPPALFRGKRDLSSLPGLHRLLLSIPRSSAGPTSALCCARWSDALSHGPEVVCQQLPAQGLAFCIVHTACCGDAKISHYCMAAFRVHSNSGDKNNNAAEPPVHVSPAASLLLQNHLVREILY